MNALIVGGGRIALRKVDDLLAAGATITLISPQCHPDLKQRIENHSIPLHERTFQPGDTAGFNLVIVATDDPGTNRAASEEARASGIPVNVVDQPDLCTVYFAAVVRRDPILLAISTGGDAPFLARALKDAAGDWLEEWGSRARWAAAFRTFVRERVNSSEARERLFSRFMAASDSEMNRWDPDVTPLTLWTAWVNQETGATP